MARTTYTQLQHSKVTITNDFGASVGGPIIKDKLFFFASLANYRRPQQTTVQTAIATSLALSGVYTYLNAATGQKETVNVLQVGASAGCSTCTDKINPIIAADLAKIQAASTAPGATISPLDLNHNLLSFQSRGSTVERFPTARLDYNVTPKFRLTGTATESNFYYNNRYAPPYPGALFSNLGSSQVERNYQVVAGFDWTIKPTLVNAFRVGYLYTGFTYNSQGIGAPTASMMQQGELAFGFGLACSSM